MVIRSALLAATAWLALLPALPARAELALPPVARVTDLTGTLNAEQQAALQKKLSDFETRKGSQIAVVMVPTVEPEGIERFSIRLGDAWKLGRKGIDDGAILVVALGDRRMRIEVGNGLQGAITDLDSSRIISEFLRPRFRDGDYYGGISAAIDRLIALADGEPLPPPARAASRPHVGFQGILPILLILGLIAGPVLRTILGRPLGAIATGGVAGFIAWLLLGALGIATFAGIATFLFTLLGGLGGGRFGGIGGGGFGGGGFGGGGFGGGGGGGGFSGGGGGFSGGGASGSW